MQLMVSPVSSNSQSLSLKILNIIFKYRRTLEIDGDSNHYCELCNVPHLERIEKFVEKGLPIHCVLPAFPCKSPNLKKVIGTLPDNGEEMALAFLSSLCRQISEIYKPGAQITICSDGRV